MKKKLLLFTDWYEPGYKAGGPIQSCRNFAAAMKEELEIYIVTSDRDQGDVCPYPGIDTNAWTATKGGQPIFYAGPGTLTLRRLRRMVGELAPDYIYLNSMYSLRFTILPLWLKIISRVSAGVVLAPRGMLHEGAIRFKPLKKKLFLTFLRAIGVGGRVVFQATDEQERRDILKYFPAAEKIVVIPNFPRMEPVDPLPVIKLQGQLSCVFISRMAPKKNLLFFLEVLKGLSPEVHLQMRLYGDIEDASYWKNCQDAIAALSPNVSVSWEGPLPNSEVIATLQRHHVFVLPTLGENYGHAIFESLMAGRPVLISDKTPWRGLKEMRVGYDLPLEASSFLQVVERLAGLDQQEYDEWSFSAYQYAKGVGQTGPLKSKYLELFQ